MQKIWTATRLPTEQTLAWTFGSLRFWVRRVPAELLLAVERSELDSDTIVLAEPGEKPESLDWQRFAVGNDYDHLKVRPMLSDRPLVVRPESALVVPPGMDSTFYARLPLWIALDMQCGDKEPVVPLIELPVLILSNTWFGEDTMTGRLCYAMRTTARRVIADLAPRRHRAICPFLIHNVSGEPLSCERFCLEVTHLAIHQRGNHLWTPTVVITHRGMDVGQTIEFNNNTPDGELLEDVLALPRDPVRGSLFQRSITSFNPANLFR